MKKLLYLFIALVLLAGCTPEKPSADDNGENQEQPQDPNTPEDPQEPEAPEEPEFPDNPLSQLTGDVELVWDPANTLVYADCYGDYYDTGLYCWSIYFMEFNSKIMLTLELMTTSQELEVPTGVFKATIDPYQDGGMLIGRIIEDMDGEFAAYSWFTQLETATTPAATAPIYYGTTEIVTNPDGTFTATLDLMDDAGNNLDGVYDGEMIIEDFRI